MRDDPVDRRSSQVLRLRPAAALAVCAALAAPAAAAPAVTLQSAAAATGRYFGAALDPAFLDDPVYRDLAEREFSSITPENAMKWRSVEPAEGVFDWGAADAVAAFAAANHQKLRGHNLLWPGHLPDWVANGRFTPAQLQRIIETHVGGEVARYRGAVYAWDVINEPFDDAGAWRGGVLHDTLGDAYVAIALRAARAADPNAKLYVNEYNIERAGAKFDALYALIASLKRSGAPIDGIGLQSHFVGGRVPPDMQAIMAKFATLGVDVAVTELDVRLEFPPDAAALSRQADDYRAVVAACVAVPRCVGVTTWGISDNHSWIPSFFSGYGAGLMFDERGEPKPAYGAAIEALRR
jgi:endo-1,4-beta-xylanase